MTITLETPTETRTGRTRTPRAAVVMATILAIDAAIHAYWATGLTWPASDQYALSSAVLGFGASFAPTVVLPLAALLAVAAGSAVLCGRDHAPPRIRRVARLVVGAVTAGAAMRATLGLLWTVPALGYTPQPFYALNLALYTPLCLVLVWAGAKLLGSARRPRAIRVATVGGPVLLALGLLVASVAYPTTEGDRSVPTDLVRPTVSSYVDAGRFGDLMPDARVEVLTGCGHGLTVDCPGGVTEAIRRFLDGR